MESYLQMITELQRSLNTLKTEKDDDLWEAGQRQTPSNPDPKTLMAFQMWNKYYKFVHAGDLGVLALCQMCQNSVGFVWSHYEEVTHLAYHLQVCHPEEYDEYTTLRNAIARTHVMYRKHGMRFAIKPEGEIDGDGGQIATNSGGQSEAQVALSQFWGKVTDEIRKINNLDLKTQALPLARIKKIMKLDDEVKMISAEAPMLFAKAAEIFIHELTLRAWVHTEDNKRRTLQRNDIAMAITKFDQFDFLIDIVPRDEVKTSKAPNDTGVRTASMNPDQVHYYFQLAQQHQAALQQNNQTSGATTLQLVQPQQVQTVNEVPSANAATQQVILQQQAVQQAAQQVSSVQQQQQQQQQQTQTAAIQIVQQVIGPNGEVQNIPITLTPQQMQMIRMQMQGNSSQPIVIQAPQTVQHTTNQQQLIQVSQQSGGPTPVYLTQSNAGTETD